MRASNFHIGDPSPSKVVTTNKASFKPPPGNFKAVTIDNATKNELRKSHWTLGGFGNSYTSSNDIAFKPRNLTVSNSDKLETVNKIQLMRGHHFNFGN